LSLRIEATIEDKEKGDDNSDAEEDTVEAEDDNSIEDEEKGGDEIVETRTVVTSFSLGTLSHGYVWSKKTMKKQLQQYMKRSLIITRVTSNL
jgi:hypothetical protein